VTDVAYGVDAAVRYPAGVTPFKLDIMGHPTEVKPRAGDFYLTHQIDRPPFPPAFWAIRLGQRLRYRGEWRAYAYWNHAGVFVDDQGMVVEALNSGVVQRNISAYKPEEYTIVYMAMSDDDRQQVRECALDHVGSRYGWLSIVNIFFRLFGGKLSYSIQGSKICSALVATCLQAAGYTFRGFDPNRIMPADLAWLANVHPREVERA